MGQCTVLIEGLGFADVECVGGFKNNVIGNWWTHTNSESNNAGSKGLGRWFELK